MIDSRRWRAADYAIQIISKAIPSVEQKILYATFLEAVLRFYENPANEAAFERWRIEKGEIAYVKTGSR